MEEIECVLCKTYSHSVLSVIAIMLPLPSVCLWHMAHASAQASLYVLFQMDSGGSLKTAACSVAEAVPMAVPPLTG